MVNDHNNWFGVKVCTESSDRAFDEQQAFPVGMAVSYLSIVFITGNPLFSIFFGYAWESFEMIVLVLNQQLLQDKHSKYAQWFASKGPLSWFVPPASDEKARPCIESPLTSLFFDPVIFIAAACLWSVGVERVAGITYDRGRAFGGCGQRFLYYVSVFFTAVFASRVLFQSRLYNVGDTERTEGAEPDIGMVMATLAFVCIFAAVPIRSGQRNGYSSVEARRAYLSYIVYVYFVVYITLFGVFGGPFIGTRSSWLRTVLVLASCYGAVLFVAAVRIGRWCDAAAGEWLKNKFKRKTKRRS